MALYLCNSMNLYGTKWRNFNSLSKFYSPIYLIKGEGFSLIDLQLGPLFLLIMMLFYFISILSLAVLFLFH